jgi:hypothetical protein
MTQFTKVSAKHTLVIVILRCHQSSKPTLGAYMLSPSTTKSCCYSLPSAPLLFSTRKNSMYAVEEAAKDG